ncbi:MAG: hypothetical protein Q4B65_00670 [Candidatus Saccharibacteria bacterium]|nr:hypothetical protein [Candidatus Saccharibacteria bacterium]
MNKRYMDFVPARAVQRPQKKVEEVVEVEEVQVTEILAERKRPVGVSTGLKEPKYGVIEDLTPKFVNTKVSKRPLSAMPRMTGSVAAKPVARANKEVATKPCAKTAVKAAGNTAVAAKAKVVKAPVKATVKTDEILKKALEEAEKVTEEKEVAKVPKPAKTSPFVNTDKIDKRPLSKNVYRKKIEELVPETPSGPVTIITKPEKDSKVGTVVAIILTIILGATAGTVAFLLLPK